MKVISSIIFALLMVFGVGIFGASAHMSDNSFMRQMMGEQAFESMESLEEQMMGEQNHERMEELMDKMFISGLTQAEQDEMIKMMRDEEAGPGTANMMARMMGGQMTRNWGTSGSWGGMMGWDGGWQVWSWVMGAGIIVWLLVGILGAIWLWKQINK